MIDFLIRITLGGIIIVYGYHLVKLIREIFAMGKEDYGSINEKDTA